MKPLHTLAVRPFRPFIHSLAIISALAAAGCEQPETIRKYETPRVEPRAVAVDPAEVRKQLDHMFAAVAPATDKAWFFKLVVPASAAEALRQPFDDFLATVDVAAADSPERVAEAERQKELPLPSWTLPEGWTAAPGGNQMRAATLTIPHGDEKFELTVSTLPLLGDWPAYLQMNVDRWMDQLAQPHLDAATIQKLGRTLPTKGKKATAFELVGTMQRAPMGMGMGPGGMPAGHPPIGASAPPQSSGLPQTSTPPSAGDTASSPPATATPPEAASSTAAAGAAMTADGFTYELPAGWRAGAPSSMRKASFAVTAGDAQAEGAIFVFGAMGEMSNPEANAARWAGMVGLANLSADEIKAAESRVDFGGLEGTRYEFYSPAGAPSAQGIIAALAVDGDQVWSIRLSGDKAAVESQSEAVNSLLKSIKFQ